ncbi:MAG TPA: BrnA antitoxin family protein [Allosphingosinicella sp.]|jgi:uncharacterized protein (DUF4415 family)|nr:BrnA antitoxin family protein [Allosphingosinicella sp.]
MNGKGRNTKGSWVDPDEPPEWADDVWARAQIAVGGEVVRPAAGTLTRRGRPPAGEEAKQQVTLRLAPAVLRHFKESGSGWQTRLGEVLERHVAGASVERRRSSGGGVHRGDHAVANKEQTGKKAGMAASKVLKSGSTGKDSKSAAGSALSQRPDKKK